MHSSPHENLDGTVSRLSAVGMAISMLLPSDTDHSDLCPNKWFYGGQGNLRYLQNANAFKNTVQVSRPASIPARDHLVTLLYAFFSGLGLRFCESGACVKLRDRYHHVIPPCRWEHLRRCVSVLAACWTINNKKWALSLLRSIVSEDGSSQQIQ